MSNKKKPVFVFDERSYETGPSALPTRDYIGPDEASPNEQENMKKKNRKPKTCQWVEGFGHDGVSAWHTCPLKPMFEVQVHGVTIAHVCPKHSIAVTQRGYQIR